MSNRNYVCVTCGEMRRAPAVYVGWRKEGWAEVEASARWPKHCEQPMKQLTFVQAEAATQLTKQARVKWLAKGMHVMRRHQHGKHKWKGVTADWQIEEAKRQKAAYRDPYLVQVTHGAGKWRQRKSLRKHRLTAEME